MSDTFFLTSFFLMYPSTHAFLGVSRQISSTTLDGKVQSDDAFFNLTLENVLQFATGAIYPPQLGFDKYAWFAHDSAVALPTTNTCSPTLTLPTAIANGDTFKKRMTYAIFNSVGFGDV